MEVIHMARQRTIKYPPKRGKLTKREVKRAVEKVVRERLEREAKEAAQQANPNVSETKSLSKTA